ncbi:MAG: hypothetical protein WDW36_006121 [Sanguina aurantia]
MQRLKAVASPIEKYLQLRTLAVENIPEYYKLLLNHTEEVLPFIYTPTVGEACERYHELPLTPHGLYISLADRGSVLQKLRACQQQDVSVVVVTDGERILGLGDLGANGMGIAEGKITLYTAGAGLDPRVCLPVCIDVGTNNATLLQDARYKGLRHKRVQGEQYEGLMDEFMAALSAWRPHVLLQFEDFGNTNAFRLLQRHRDAHCCFNDDIQGTASICLAALLSASRHSGIPMQEQRFLFYGAGEAGTGIGSLIAYYLHKRCGMTLEAAHKHCYFMDTKGLVCASRTNLPHHKQPFAHDVSPQSTLLAAIKALRPTSLIGVSTSTGAFTEAVVSAMADMHPHPIIFPLSNPTSKSECTFQQALTWSRGKAIFASGSPYDPITTSDGHTIYPAQANNAYIFPALGAAAVLTRCSKITDECFLVAAETLAELSPVDEIQNGRLFPPLSQLRQVSAKVTAAVAALMVSTRLGSRPSGCEDWLPYVTSRMWAAPRAKI